MAQAAAALIDAFQTTGSSPGDTTDAVIALGPFELENGGRLEGAHLAIRSTGPTDAPTVAALGGISAGRDVVGPNGSGWWEGLVGPRRAVDTTQFRVIGIDWLAGRGQSTPVEGLPFGADTPLTPRDQARALTGALDTLGIHRLHAIVGASYGGMTALAFAAAHPERLGRLVVLGAADGPHPMATALRSLQRDIVRLGGTGEASREALVLARALAMTTYRSTREFAQRFAHAPDGDTRFEVVDYLQRCGEHFADTFAADAFVCLSRSIDLHRVDPRAIRTPTTLVAFEPDAIAPVWQVRSLAGQLGGRWTLRVLRSIYGHDAFLKETDALTPIVSDALCRPEVTR